MRYKKPPTTYQEQAELLISEVIFDRSDQKLALWFDFMRTIFLSGWNQNLIVHPMIAMALWWYTANINSAPYYEKTTKGNITNKEKNTCSHRYAVFSVGHCGNCDTPLTHHAFLAALHGLLYKKFGAPLCMVNKP